MYFQMEGSYQITECMSVALKNMVITLYQYLLLTSSRPQPTMSLISINQVFQDLIVSGLIILQVFFLYFYLLTPFMHYCLPPASGNHQSLLHIYELEVGFLFCVCFFQIAHKRDHRVFVSSDFT